MVSDISPSQFLALFQSVALEVQAEHKNQSAPKKPQIPDPGQRYNAQGQPLYRTRAVDPEYHAKLDARHAARENNASFEQARRRSMG